MSESGLVEKIGTCPFCKSQGRIRHDFVHCSNSKCRACGPIGNTRNEAIARWNAASNKITALTNMLAVSECYCGKFLTCFRCQGLAGMKDEGAEV